MTTNTANEAHFRSATRAQRNAIKVLVRGRNVPAAWIDRITSQWHTMDAAKASQIIGCLKARPQRPNYRDMRPFERACRKGAA